MKTSVSSKSHHPSAPARRVRSHNLLLAAIALALACGGEDTLAPTPVGAINLTPSIDTLTSEGQTAQLTAFVVDATGALILGKNVVWSSTDVSLASVSASGIVTAEGPNGTVTISAAADGVTGSATIVIATTGSGGTVVSESGTVTLVVPQGAVITPFQTTIRPVAPGSSPDLVSGTAFEFGPDSTQFAVPVQLTIKYDPTGLPPGATENWLTLNRLNGGVWEGLTDSHVDTTANTVSASILSFSTYGILGSTASTVDIEPQGATVAVGQTLQLQAVPRDADGQPLIGQTIIWSGDDQAVATVDQDGLVTGVDLGAVTISARAGTATGTSTVNVGTAVASVDISLDVPTLHAGDIVQLTAVARDAAGTPITGLSTTWASNNSKVATVDQTGQLTAVGTGTATVTAVIQGVTGARVVTVAPVG